ncbi:MAG TPA: transcription repressor NadR [Defluviitaleaceae bacterium]|nr:transcription repressor NadR [Defluviitaleaceae bacterium]
MDKEERRNTILAMLKETNKPLTGKYLAEKLGVTRQIIVQDIALLRAENNDIMSTARGYIFYDRKQHVNKRVITVCHGKDSIEDELTIIVDFGGRVLDVIIEHPIYGEIIASLIIESRRDIKEFMEIMKKNDTVPLLKLTSNIHMHTIEAKNEEILDEIENELRKKGYLILEN